MLEPIALLKLIFCWEPEVSSVVQHLALDLEPKLLHPQMVDFLQALWRSMHWIHLHSFMPGKPAMPGLEVEPSLDRSSDTIPGEPLSDAHPVTALPLSPMLLRVYAVAQHFVAPSHLMF